MPNEHVYKCGKDFSNALFMYNLKYRINDDTNLAVAIKTKFEKNFTTA